MACGICNLTQFNGFLGIINHVPYVDQNLLASLIYNLLHDLNGLHSGAQRNDGLSVLFGVCNQSRLHFDCLLIGNLGGIQEAILRHGR